ncbi:MAG: class I SAM-dependent methyltransferase [Pseudomonadota bacterium]
MLSPFLKSMLSGYDESCYRIAPSDFQEILRANGAMEETGRLDLSLPAASEISTRRVSLAIKAAAIQIPYDGMVVDLCCGTGYIARSLLAMQKVGSVIGIDLSGGQLNLLKRVVDKDAKMRGKLSVLQADTLRLPFADNCIDLIIGNSFLHHLPDVGVALTEIGRVIKPGGQFVVLHEPSLTATFFESFPWSLFKNIRIENYTDLWQFDPGDLRRLLEQAGFTEIKILKTGVFANTLFGAFSIVINKFWPRWDKAKLLLEHLKGSLSAFEYRFSLTKAPSLLIQATWPRTAA